MSDPPQSGDEMPIEEALAMQQALIPTIDAQLDLSRDEKRRTTAIVLAMKLHSDLLIRDAALYDALRRDGKNLRTLNIDEVATTAAIFEWFIRTGTFKPPKEIEEPAQTAPDAEP
jgi:hypothetical protein